MIEPGETLLGFDFGNHLHIFVSRETGEGLIALVNLTTHGRSARCGRGRCVIVQPADHPWVHRPSCVPYRYALLTPARPLIKAKRQGSLRQHAPCSSSVLRRVQEGALRDPETPTDVAAAVRSVLRR